ncbi:beta-hexosaminidase 1 isoform X2 [Beta vulgaris subsp. vulgaris]|uniref:beta-hexosaminidase 1 isoform X2 n=1 Tax=Beta vulgaris subsp. vulgaris TaxID=3555 RepID=UPI002546EB38|nr:beta-hexosaminidase 1 isoform X2 [Beta vulgaris subsp. vulgaris]
MLTSTSTIITSPHALIFSLLLPTLTLLSLSSPSSSSLNDSLTYIWPLPEYFTSGDETLTVDPDLSLSFSGGSPIISDAFFRYKRLIFTHAFKIPAGFRSLRFSGPSFDIGVLQIVVHSSSEELQLGVDESYILKISGRDDHSIVGVITIEANTVYGALRALETFSQLCTFDYISKTVKVFKAPWYIQDKPRFAYRGLLIDTSRHYLPLNVIKHIIDSMSYAKLNVLHWHIVDEESFPLETPSYPYLWKDSYSKSERYTVEDAYEIVKGVGYPDLWPSSSCKEPLDVSKNFTFDVVSGILTDLKKIFPFELFHLGGDEVNTDCWNSTAHIKQWNMISIRGTVQILINISFMALEFSRLHDRNMTRKDAYQYFVLKAQEIAITNNRTPVNWEETFISFPTKLNPRTIVHNWLVSGICPKAVAKGFRCIFSNQDVWYLDHLDVPWQPVYKADPLENITDVTQQKLILGGEVCMWGETADTSDIQQTIWPRAAAAAERLWSRRGATSEGNISITALPRLHYFRCLLNMRGVQAAPVTNYYARRPPTGPGSCYEQ